MRPDITSLLERAAHTPAGDLDAGTLRRRGRQVRYRRRARQGVAVALVLAAVPAGFGVVRAGWLAPEPATPVRPLRPPVEVSPEATPNTIVPATRSLGDRVVMPVTFLDGTTAEVVYPAGLRIAELGARPFGYAELDGCCSRDLMFPPGGAAWFAEGGAPLGQLPGADGQPVTLWPGNPQDELYEVDRYLVYQFGDWTLGVPDGMGDDTMSDGELRQWASLLRGRQTPDGFLVLDATSPLRLSFPEAIVPTPAIKFGGPGGNEVTVTATPCDEPVKNRADDGHGIHGTVCRPEWSATVNASGESGFVDAVLRDVAIRNVRRPAAPGAGG